MTQVKGTVGEMLRQWRVRRRLSQLDLAGEADISSRYLSFVETGRSVPSWGMVLHLAESLAVPLRERNVLLSAAGYAPIFPEQALSDLGAARQAVEAILKGHEPYPALAINRHWSLVAANHAVDTLLVEVAPRLLVPPVNVLRLSLHPEGIAPRIENLAQWRAHLLAEPRQQVEFTADPVLLALLEELQSYPVPRQPGPSPAPRSQLEIAVPLRLVTPQGILSLISTTTVFGTPVDVTLSELALECFFPVDEATARILRRLAVMSACGVQAQSEAARLRPRSLAAPV
ncbi:helix-turn-helix domain-containing protein [Deinococcus alpinitundrae]|uniref:helix-turn-helix domain-containing protein n=1 Tax=Deinococcus alpinitundrae TaxID=468913 RepID=UPI00137A7B23|nr:helix-turn-helix domain-containing protein [Deinococcus alpinitundrae]